MPLLQHALLELWKRRTGAGCAPAEYRAIGGVQGAIARTADAVYEQLPAGRPGARAGRLPAPDPAWTSPDGGPRREPARDTRRRVALDELVPAGGDPAPDAGPGGAPGRTPAWW